MTVARYKFPQHEISFHSQLVHFNFLNLLRHNIFPKILHQTHSIHRGILNEFRDTAFKESNAEILS